MSQATSDEWQDSSKDSQFVDLTQFNLEQEKDAFLEKVAQSIYGRSVLLVGTEEQTALAVQILNETLEVSEHDYELFRFDGDEEQADNEDSLSLVNVPPHSRGRLPPQSRASAASTTRMTDITEEAEDSMLRSAFGASYESLRRQSQPDRVYVEERLKVGAAKPSERMQLMARYVRMWRRGESLSEVDLGHIRSFATHPEFRQSYWPSAIATMIGEAAPRVKSIPMRGTRPVPSDKAHLLGGTDFGARWQSMTPEEQRLAYQAMQHQQRAEAARVIRDEYNRRAKDLEPGAVNRALGVVSAYATEAIERVLPPNGGSTGERKYSK